MGEPSADTTAVIVTWNSVAHVRSCLASLAGAGIPIIVVDNASDDTTVADVASGFPDVRIVRSPVNRGFAGGVNVGVAASTSRYVLLLNPDVVASAGAVGRLVAFLESHPAYAGAAGRLDAPDGTWQRGFNIRRLPTIVSLAVDLLLLDHLWPTNPVTRRERALDLAPDVPTDVEQPAAACLLVRRTTFDAVGGMDERFHPAWFEDVDFCRRLHARGWPLAYRPEARFTHVGGSSVAVLGRVAFTRHFHRNMVRYVRKHHGRLAVGLLRGLIAVGMLLRATAACIGGRGAEARAYLRVCGDACAGWH